MAEDNYFVRDWWRCSVNYHRPNLCRDVDKRSIYSNAAGMLWERARGVGMSETEWYFYFFNTFEALADSWNWPLPCFALLDTSKSLFHKQLMTVLFPTFYANYQQLQVDLQLRCQKTCVHLNQAHSYRKGLTGKLPPELSTVLSIRYGMGEGDRMCKTEWYLYYILF